MGEKKTGRQGPMILGEIIASCARLKYLSTVKLRGDARYRRSGVTMHASPAKACSNGSDSRKVTISKVYSVHRTRVPSTPQTTDAIHSKRGSVANSRDPLASIRCPKTVGFNMLHLMQGITYPGPFELSYASLK